MAFFQYNQKSRQSHNFWNIIMFEVRFTFEFHEYSNRNLSESETYFLENSKKKWFFVKYTNVSEIKLKSKENIQKIAINVQKKVELASFEHYVEDKEEFGDPVTKNYLFLKSKI